MTITLVGRLPDGTIFVSTEGKDPLDIELQQLVPGLQICMEGMRPGGKRVVTVPPQWGYGQGQDAPGNVPPRSKLIFEVELHAVK